MKKAPALILSLCLAALLLAGCGGGEAPAPEAPPAEPTAEPAAAAELNTFFSGDGWSVQYDPALIRVEEREADRAVDFVYAGDTENASTVTIRTVPDKLPEEVLYEVTVPWGDEDAVTRIEGFFPGADGMWGYWRILPPAGDTGYYRTAIAGEYNGGVLLVEEALYLTGDDPADAAAGSALETIVDSLAYEDFEAQTMYAYIPGRYVALQDGEISSVTLNEDHTGVISAQEDTDIFWGSTELTAVDGSAAYEYTIEGDALYINYNGDWLELSR